jgi:hypothetical protein
MWPKSIKLLKKGIRRVVASFILVLFPLLFIAGQLVCPSESFVTGIKQEWAAWKRTFWN